MLDHLAIQCADVGRRRRLLRHRPGAARRQPPDGLRRGDRLRHRPKAVVLARPARRRRVQPAEVARRLRRPRPGRGARLLRRRGRRRRRGAPRAAGLARVPPRLLRRVRARPRRQQRRSRLPPPRSDRPSRPHAELVRRARAVLDRNRAGDYTCPSVRLYPHQWLWDSCFTAIGIARFDPPRAADELRALFRGQWDNGMLPHMIFADGSQRRRQPPGLAVADRAPARRATSPPRASRSRRSSRSRSSESRRALPDDDGSAFVAELAPKVARVPPLAVPRATARRLAARSRSSTRGSAASTPRRRGCARSRRCGCRGGCAPRSSSTWRALLRSLRYDTRQLPANERASDDDGLRMLALAIHLARHDFDLAPHPARRPRRCWSRTSRSTRSSPPPTSRCATLTRRRRCSTIRTSTRRPRRSSCLWHAPTHEYCSRHAVTHAADERPHHRHLPAAAHVGTRTSTSSSPGCRIPRRTGRRTRCRACRSRPATSRTTATGPAPPG